jgi:serine/threonine-protein kinase
VQEVLVDGTPFGRYRLVGLLGRGGMGEVWRAYDTGTDRVVALKVLPAHFAEDPTFEQRFRREAHAAARVRNPHIVPIHDHGEIDGRLFVDMVLIEGHDLAVEIANGQLEPSRAVKIVEQIARALHAAHKAGLVHRDVKPSKILLDEDDFAYLIDFGIARAAADTGLTGTGATIGTWAYMAPERFTTDEVDARGDVYALACVLYESLTGTKPFPGDSLERQFAGHLTAPPPRPSTTRPDVPAEFDAVIAAGMAKDPVERFQGTIELAAAARATITGTIERPKPVTAPPSPPADVTSPAPIQLPGQPPAEAPPAKPMMWEVAPNPARDLQPEQPTQQRSSPANSATSRRNRPLLIATSAVAVVAIVATIAIVATRNDRPTTSSDTTYGAQVTLPFGKISRPQGVAVDPVGTVYLDEDRVLTLAADASTLVELPFSNHTSGLAVGTTGTVYVTGNDLDSVLKLPAGASTPSTIQLGSGHGEPDGVAVDTTGAIYVAIVHTGSVLKLAADATATTKVPFPDLDEPAGVAVDSTGALYVADAGNERILKLAVDAIAPTTLPFTGLSRPRGVAIDSTGTIYVVDSGNNRVLKLAADATTATTLPFAGLNDPQYVAVDTAGAIYVTDTFNDRVVKLPVA